jgi:hypothetical protein
MLGCHGEGKADKFAETARAWRSPAKRPWRAQCLAATGCQVMSAWDGT